jgi:hypothetical protein
MHSQRNFTYKCASLRPVQNTMQHTEAMLHSTRVQNNEAMSLPPTLRGKVTTGPTKP